MNKAELQALYLEHGPKDPYQLLILQYLIKDCDERFNVAVSPAQVAAMSGMSEKTVRAQLRRLTDAAHLQPLGENAYRIMVPSRGRTHTHASAHTRNKENLITKEITLNESLNADQHLDLRARESSALSTYRGHSGSSSAPVGSGARNTLGVENCPRCGGTGWQLAIPSGPWGQETVDVCTCRGGPEVTVPESYRAPAAGAIPEKQRAVNVDGLTAVREVLGNESQTRLQDSGMEAPASPSADKG